MSDLGNHHKLANKRLINSPYLLTKDDILYHCFLTFISIKCIFTIISNLHLLSKGQTLFFQQIKSSRLQEPITPSTFNQFLRMRCQNVNQGFLCLPVFNLLVHLTSNLIHSFPNLFTFLGPLVVNTIL